MNFRKLLYVITTVIALALVGCRSNEIPENDGRLPDLESMESYIEPVEQSGAEVVNVEYGYIYGGICDYVISTVDENGGSIDYLTCALYDMNNDGYKEFIVENGTCAADVVFEVYTTDGSSAIYLGEIAGYCSFYKEENGNGIYTDFCNGGYEIVEHVFVQGDSLGVETVLEQQTDNYGFYEGKYIEELTYALEMEYLTTINFSAYSVSAIPEEETAQEEFLDPNEYAEYEEYETYEPEMIVKDDISVYSLDYVAEYIEKHNIEIPKERYKNKINKALKDDSQMIAVEVSGGEKVRYSATNYEGDLFYVGKMKDNVPNGWGKIIRVVQVSEMEYYGYPLISIDIIAWGWSDEDKLVPVLVYVGEFEDGYYSGYGWKYADHFESNEIYESEISYEYVDSTGDLVENILMNCNPVEYMGEFKKSLYDGEGILLTYGAREVPFEMTDEEQMEAWGIVLDKEIEFYIGEFKKGELRGEAKHYLVGNLRYEGGYHDWSYDGEGTLYYIGSTQKLYEGEWSMGDYHGKGTLYNEDGSVKYRGKWSRGDYAN